MKRRVSRAFREGPGSQAGRIVGIDRACLARGSRCNALLLLLAVPVAGQSTIDLRETQLPEWELVEDLRIGSVDGPHDAFASPSGLQLDEDGMLYILDGGIPALKIFDPAGNFVGQVGRPGEGPGEYRAPGAFGLWGGTIWVSDARLGRLTIFQVDGTVVSSRRFGAAGSDPPLPVRMLSDEEFFAITPVSPPQPIQLGEPGLIRFPQALVITDETGQVLDTVATSVSEFPIVRLSGGGVVGVPFLVRGQPLVGYLEDQDLVREVFRPAPAAGESASFRIRLRDRGGTTVLERDFIDAPRAIRATTRDSLRLRLEDHLPPEMPATVRDAVWEQVRPPDFYPPVGGVATMGTGETWVRREELPGDPLRFLILDSELWPIASVTLPGANQRRIGPLGPEHLWVVDRDAFDVPYLVRYRILR